MSLAGDYSYVGVGKVRMRKKCADAPLVEIGNVSALTINVQTDSLEQRDFTRMGGGMANTLERITGVTLDMTLLDMSPHNVAMAVLGTTSTVDADEVISGEELKAYKSAFVPTEHLINTDEPVTVALDTTTYTVGTDYVVTKSGLEIPADSSIVNGSTVEVTYTAAAQTRIEALTNVAAVYELHFDGLNEAKSGSAATVKVYSLQMTPAQAMALITENHGELAVSGKVLVDNCRTGVGVSKYFTQLIEVPSANECC